MKQAVEVLLPLWTEIDTDDALELLGPNTVDSRVRSFAVKQLRRADDDVRALLIIAFIHAHALETGAHPISTTTRTSSKI